MKKSYVLKTERLTLREICAEDAASIVSLRADPEVYQFFLNPHKITVEEHSDWYQAKYIYDENRYDWIGEDPSGNTVGIFGTKRLSSSEAEVNYILDRMYYGKGYAREAVGRIIDFCKEVWNVRSVIATIHKNNQKSIRFAEKLGFSKAEDSGNFVVYRKETKKQCRNAHTLYFRADANPSIGMGHIMRCLSIADAAEQRSLFVLADESAAAVVKSRGYEAIILHSDYRTPETELPFWETVSPDLIVVDSYYATTTYLSALQNIATLLYIDDLCAFPYPADYLLNYNAYAPFLDYQSLYAKENLPVPRLMLGPTYAPLRSMFRNVPLKKQNRTVQNVLISTGGADPEHIALKFVAACPTGFIFYVLAGALNPDRELLKNYAQSNIVLCENVADMRSLIERMDVAVSAAGSTLYELCACGVPLITYAIADNQLPGAEAFDRLGLSENLGDMRAAEDPAERILKAVEKLSRDDKRRSEMGLRMQKMIDGDGAKRVWAEISKL